MSNGLVLFHRIDDPASAAIRSEVVARGLKVRIDFQNVDSEEGAALFAARGGGDVPALWDGERLRTGAAIAQALADLG